MNNTKLTLQVKNHCFVVFAEEKAGSAPMVLGSGNGLPAFTLTAGRGSLQGQEETRMVLPGSLVVGQDSLHFYPVGQCELVFAQLAGKGAEEVAMQLTEPLVLPEGSCTKASQLLHQMMAGFVAQPSLQGLEEEQAANLARNIQNSALGYSFLCAIVQASPVGRQLPALVAAAIALMHSYYGEVYGVEELAGELEVSKSHLIRSFTASVGISPGKYLTMVRLEAARRLLLQNELNLDMIASLCGFSGANYLCRVFKKEFGETPLGWRQSHLPQIQPEPAQSEWEESIYL